MTAARAEATAAGRKPAGLSALMGSSAGAEPLRDGLLPTRDPLTSAVRPRKPRCDTRKSPLQLRPEGGSRVQPGPSEDPPETGQYPVRSRPCSQEATFKQSESFRKLIPGRP